MRHEAVGTFADILDDVDTGRGALGAVRFDYFLFYGAFFLLAFNGMLSSINFDPGIQSTCEKAGDLIGALAILMLILKLCFQRYVLKTIVFPALFLLTGLFVKIRTGDSTFFFICLLGIASEGIELKKLAKCLFICCLVVMAFDLLCFAFGFAGNVVLNDQRALLGARFSLGFSHPNVLGRMLVVLGSCATIFSGERRSLRGFCFVAVLTVIALFVADSRTAVLFLLLCAALLLVDGGSSFLASINWAAVARWFYLAALLLVVFLMAFYSKFPLLTQLNRILSYRLEFWNGSFNAYGIQLFGSELVPGRVLNMYGNDAQLDGAYACELIQWGALVTAFFCVLVFLFTVQIERGNSKKTAILLLGFFILGLTENYAFSPLYNVIIVGAASIFNPNSITPLFRNRGRAK